MKKTKRTPAGEALTNLMLDLFRLSSRLLTVGDRLAAGLGLTSARWQILGALTYANVRNRLRGLLATSVPIVKTCSGSSTTCTKRVSSHSRSIRITGELNSSR